MTQKTTPIKLFKPHKVQQEIIKAVHNKDIKFIVVPCARRVGKTEAVLNIMTEWAITKNDQRILYMLPTDLQRVGLWNDYVKLFGDAPFINKLNKGDDEITFHKTKSVIKFRLASYPSVDSLRGQKFDLIILDEYASYNDSVMETILLPTLATAKNYKVMIVGSPKGKGSFFKYYLKGIDPNESKWWAITAPTAANPYVDPQFIIDMKNTMSPNIFRQEILGEFIDDTGSIFENIELVATGNKFSYNPKEKYFAGIDLGFKNDYTVLTIINSNGDIVFIDRFNDCALRTAAERLNKSLVQWGYPMCYIENNAYQGVSELLIKDFKTRNVTEFNTNTKTKPEIILYLIERFESKAITIPDQEYILLEFKNYSYTYNDKTKNISFNASTGNDDIVMSTAIAFRALKDNAFKKINYRFI